MTNAVVNSLVGEPYFVRQIAACCVYIHVDHMIVILTQKHGQAISATRRLNDVEGRSHEKEAMDQNQKLDRCTNIHSGNARVPNRRGAPFHDNV